MNRSSFFKSLAGLTAAVVIPFKFPGEAHATNVAIEEGTDIRVISCKRSDSRYDYDKFTLTVEATNLHLISRWSVLLTQNGEKFYTTMVAADRMDIAPVNHHGEQCRLLEQGEHLLILCSTVGEHSK